MSERTPHGTSETSSTRTALEQAAIEELFAAKDRVDQARDAYEGAQADFEALLDRGPILTVEAVHDEQPVITGVDEMDSRMLAYAGNARVRRMTMIARKLGALRRGDGPRSKHDNEDDDPASIAYLAEKLDEQLNGYETDEDIETSDIVRAEVIEAIRTIASADAVGAEVRNEMPQLGSVELIAKKGNNAPVASTDRADAKFDDILAFGRNRGLIDDEFAAAVQNTEQQTNRTAEPDTDVLPVQAAPGDSEGLGMWRSLRARIELVRSHESVRTGTQRVVGAFALALFARPRPGPRRRADKSSGNVLESNGNPRN